MRKLALGLVFLVLVGAAAWSALWFYAAHEVGAQVDALLKSEDGSGRDWTCPDRTIEGYPLALTIRCVTPTFTGHALDQTLDVRAAALTAEASLLHPQRLVLHLQSPLTYKASDGQADLKATWSALDLELGDLPNLQTVVLRGTGVAVDGSFGDAGRQGGSVAQLDASFTRAGTADDPTLAFLIAARGAPVPPIDDLIGGEIPVDLDLAGTLDCADVAAARTLEEAIEIWRQAGGRVELASSRLSRADSSVTGNGTLRLDEAHRPQGRINASFVGLEPILKRYGISANLAAAGSLLSTLFGGGSPPPAPAAPGTLNLPISLQDGRIGIGPIRTQITVPALY